MKGRLVACTILLLTIIISAVSCLGDIGNDETAIPETVSYNFHIRPFFLINVLSVMDLTAVTARLVCV